MHATIKTAGIVHITTPDSTETKIIFADRGREADNLREQADELRARASALLERAGMLDLAADRLS